MASQFVKSLHCSHAVPPNHGTGHRYIGAVLAQGKEDAIRRAFRCLCGSLRASALRALRFHAPYHTVRSTGPNPHANDSPCVSRLSIAHVHPSVAQEPVNKNMPFHGKYWCGRGVVVAQGVLTAPLAHVPHPAPLMSPVACTRGENGRGRLKRSWAENLGTVQNRKRNHKNNENESEKDGVEEPPS